ncbi:unnamed protein product [Gongylonema pulchrum]|uniref:C2H2-type domain-containing protein n=1 Tax=Gongylonema pulchrum TaxID=637853 RepID=A0A3P7N896_9BILA|nr:unnamed protein product [Gongylonema pulchrum]VDN40755.1 unnamed protein product [Gongylonema pulchrum]
MPERKQHDFLNNVSVSASITPTQVEKRVPHQCPECGKQLRSVVSLRQHHVRYHSSESPHVCSVCSQKCVYRSELIKHMRMHSGERPFKCSVCNVRFTRNEARKRHMRKHTGEKPYTCEFCNSSFSRIDHFKNHKKTHYRPAAM